MWGDPGEGVCVLCHTPPHLETQQACCSLHNSTLFKPKTMNQSCSSLLVLVPPVLGVLPSLKVPSALPGGLRGRHSRSPRCPRRLEGHGPGHQEPWNPLLKDRRTPRNPFCFLNLSFPIWEMGVLFCLWCHWVRPCRHSPGCWPWTDLSENCTSSGATRGFINPLVPAAQEPWFLY